MNNIKEKYMDEHLPKRLLAAFVCATLFVIVGLMLPDLYYHYLDNTEYFAVTQPIPVAQKWYKPCDDVILTATRTSLIDTDARFSVDLVLKDQTGQGVLKVPNAHFNTEASVKSGESQTISVVYRLPCSLADGLYYWQATMTYHVKGFERQYTYVSDTFHVNKYGLDPKVIEAATSSAQLITPRRVNPSTRVESAPIPTSAPTQNTTIINNNTAPQPTSAPTPNPTPNQPNPPVPSGVCLPILGCIR